jgi:hypothetical protein
MKKEQNRERKRKYSTPLGQSSDISVSKFQRTNIRSLEVLGTGRIKKAIGNTTAGPH